MYFSKFRLENYKSILSSKDLSFTPGFNVIVGRNDVGKTAFVEGLSLAFGNVPPRNLKTIPLRGAPSPFESRSHCTIHLSGDEMQDILLGVPQFSIPVLSNGDEVASVGRFKELLTTGADLTFRWEANDIHDLQFPQYPYPDTPNLDVLIYRPQPGTTRIPENPNGKACVRTQDTFGYQLAPVIRSRIYTFKAERPIIGEAPMAPNSELANNASNLATVLHYLFTNQPYDFGRFKDLVHDVFPHIKQIRMLPIDQTKVRIYIGTVEPEKRREDLDIPLAECGTGIGQVLAMLYVVFTAEFPRIIVIDEPQSFLHPGAVYRLFDILKTMFPQHQYIVTTHSPAVVAAADPETLFLLRRDEGETEIQAVDRSEITALTGVLAELGARLTEVFGADRLLWVEGATEERCFPMIYRALTKQSRGGAQILGVLNTGDLDSKAPDRILGIYERLSQGNALMPPTVGFLFDRELRTPEQREDWKRRSNEAVAFLERRMYENYLLEPEAIAVALNTADPSDKTHVTASEVEEWLGSHGQSDKLLESNARHCAFPEEAWYTEVHGARVLEQLFQELSEGRVAYDKIRHGETLTRWFLDHKPETLQPIADAISGFLDHHTR